MRRMLAVLVLVAAPAAAQNLVANGDFERTDTTGCAFNLTNPEFGAAMPGCAGFGTLLGNGEIDIMQGGSCGYGLPAASGLIKLGIASDNNGTGSDAFSMRLKEPLVPGVPYRLTFKANAYVSTFSPQIGAVEVGLSESATSFGTKVGELLPSAVVWSSFRETIVPATPAGFLTVRYQATSNGWDHVDDFTLEVASSAGLAIDTDGSTIRVAGATPGALVAVLISPATGSGDEPVESTRVGTLATVLVADVMGGLTLEQGLVPCARLQLQAVDLSTGAVSPVATVDRCHPGRTGWAESGDELGPSGPSPPTPLHH